MRQKLKTLDVVALLKDVPEHNLKKGQVGTIVEKWEDGVFEVEFADKMGQAISFLAVKQDDLLKLYFEEVAA